jgi:hypothetical protein
MPTVNPTTAEVLAAVAAVLPSGSYHYLTFRRDAKRLGVRPTGRIRTRPRYYPPDTARRVLQMRGAIRG